MAVQRRILARQNISTDVNDFLNGLGIGAITEEALLLELALLDKQFLKTYGTSPELIEQQIHDGLISESTLVQRWIDLQNIKSDVLRTKPKQGAL